MSVNRYLCTGNLTKDPELRELPSGASVCELRVAVDGMGRGYEPGFITVSVFGKPGEAAAELLAKGSLVAIDGRLEFSEWEADGATRHDYSVVGNVEFLSLQGSETPPAAKGRRRSEPVPA